MHQRNNLHAYWDALGWIPEKNNKPLVFVAKLQSRVDCLLHRPEYEEERSVAAQKASELEPRTWVAESHELCKSAVYTNEVMEDTRAHWKPEKVVGDDGKKHSRLAVLSKMLSDDYHEEAQNIADQQMLIAGYRLAELLKKSLPK